MDRTIRIRAFDRKHILFNVYIVCVCVCASTWVHSRQFLFGAGAGAGGVMEENVQ